MYGVARQKTRNTGILINPVEGLRRFLALPHDHMGIFR